MAESDEPQKVPETPHGQEAGSEHTDPETDQAVDDIVRKEGDDELKAQDTAAGRVVVMKQGPWEKFKNFQARWWGNPRTRWGSVAAAVVVLGALAGIPLTRYEIAGLVMRPKVTVQVADSKTGTPVSGAEVQMGAASAETDGDGKAVLYPHAGSRQLHVTKKYYKGADRTVLVTLSAKQNTFKASLTALGRQVQLKLTNKITGKPVTGAMIKAGEASAKTNKDGIATVIVPGSVTMQESTASLAGYNDAKITVDVNASLAKNTFSITPAGKLYFLSNLSGTIDVVKTNLDGSSRQTVLAGTGKEDRNSTSLLASRDWKYLVLLAKRDGDNASVYLIDTTNVDKLTTVDEGDADFSLVGWSGDKLVYQVTRHNVADSQPNQSALKSFDPTTGHTLLLDQTQGSDPGNVSGEYVKQVFTSTYLMGSQVVYTKSWQGNNGNFGPNVLDGKQAELDSISADGSGHHVIKSFAPDSYPVGSTYFTVWLSTKLYGPNGLYIDFTATGISGDKYYEYEDGKVVDANDVTSDTFYNTPYPTYLLSPSGNQNFWADQRDGKNVLLTGDADAKSPKQLGSLSDYNAYGWFTDDYVLVSKSSSELYIMPIGGGTPLKVTDYYKPAINYQGYGGGYGGL